jgi:hypothetical protein
MTDGPIRAPSQDLKTRFERWGNGPAPSLLHRWSWTMVCQASGFRSRKHHEGRSWSSMPVSMYLWSVPASASRIGLEAGPLSQWLYAEESCRVGGGVARDAARPGRVQDNAGAMTPVASPSLCGSAGSGQFTASHCRRGGILGRIEGVAAPASRLFPGDRRF